MPQLSNGDTSESKYHAYAGAMTGLVEYSIMYPIDFIKTRMQVLKPPSEATYKSVGSCIVSIVKDEGVLRFFRGMPAPFMFSIPAHSIYYVTYEKLRRKLSGSGEGYHSPLAQGIAGAAAVINHNIVMNPADVIKQRMQVYDTPYKSSIQCFRQVLHKERFRAFYRSLPTQLAIDAPYGSLHFVMYEFFQNITNPKRTFDAKSHVLSGALAGGIAAAATTPLDVCRTLINIQEKGVVRDFEKSLVRGLPSAVRLVYRTRGIRGFFRGLTPRVMHHVPSVALCWFIYEFFKRYFVEMGRNSHKKELDSVIW